MSNVAGMESYFVIDRIVCADAIIVELALCKIKENDVILTYGKYLLTC